MEVAVEVAGATVRLDEADLPLLRSKRWYVAKKLSPSGREYRYLATKKGRQLFHRAVLQAPAGFVVDHIDGDGLNNTRSNLRLCSHAENMRNRRPNSGKALPKGVHQNKATFSAEIRAGAIRRRKRGFKSPEAAAECYRQWAQELHGNFCRAE